MVTLYNIMKHNIVSILLHVNIKNTYYIYISLFLSFSFSKKRIFKGSKRVQIKYQITLLFFSAPTVKIRKICQRKTHIHIYEYMYTFIRSMKKLRKGFWRSPRHSFLLFIQKEEKKHLFP